MILSGGSFYFLNCFIRMKNTTHNKDLFQNIFEASVEGIIVVNEDGLILMANPACELLFGYEPGRLTEVGS